MSRQSMQVIMILESCYDMCQCFDDGEMVGPTMPIRTIGYCYLDKGGQR